MNPIFRSVVFILIFLQLSVQAMYADSKDDILEKKFKALGIIRLAKIAPMADDDLIDMKGNSVKLSDFKGKIVFLNFWTTWCPDCVFEMPDIERLHKKLGGKDLMIIALDLKESKEKVEKFILKHDLSFKILLDEKGGMGRAFGIRSIPTTFILGRDGGLMGKAMGARNWDSRESVSLFKYLIQYY
jgi:thiol-disulfide isomerase/thioredoxin